MTAPAVAPAHTGRPSLDDLEARTPLGQVLHWIEARLLDGVRSLGLFEGCHEIERLHNDAHDAALLRGIALGDDGRPWIEVRAELMEAVRLDALADDADHEGAQHVKVGIRRVFQRIGAWVERTAVALRGRR